VNLSWLTCGRGLQAQAFLAVNCELVLADLWEFGGYFHMFWLCFSPLLL